MSIYQEECVKSPKGTMSQELWRFTEERADKNLQEALWSQGDGWHLTHLRKMRKYLKVGIEVGTGHPGQSEQNNQMWTWKSSGCVRETMGCVQDNGSSSLTRG